MPFARYPANLRNPGVGSRRAAVGGRQCDFRVGSRHSSPPSQLTGQLPPAFLQDFHNLGAQTGAGRFPGRGLVILLRGSDQNPVVFAMSPSYSLVALAILLFLAWFVVGRLTRQRAVAKRELWAGGIPRLWPEMSYTATGFSNPVRVVFQAIFRPNIVEDTRETVGVHFRTAIRRRRDETHLVDRLFLQPLGDASAGSRDPWQGCIMESLMPMLATPWPSLY